MANFEEWNSNVRFEKLMVGDERRRFIIDLVIKFAKFVLTRLLEENVMEGKCAFLFWHNWSLANLGVPAFT